MRKKRPQNPTAAVLLSNPKVEKTGSQKISEPLESDEDENKPTGKGSKDSPNYWQRILLVIIGALIGIVPSILTTNLQAKVQLKQFLLDRQIATLKEYSTSFNFVTSNMMASVLEMDQKTQMWVRANDIL